MPNEVTDDWIIQTMLKNDWCLNTEVFVYPRGADKGELDIPPGENVCASITDVLYLSRHAVYVRDRSGKYTRLPWDEIEDADWTLRKVSGRTVQAIRYTTTTGKKIVVPMPFQFVPYYFGTVHDTCVQELTPAGRTCTLPGPSRLLGYAQPVAQGAKWAQPLVGNRSTWTRGMVCPCGCHAFILRYLGRLLEDGTIADGTFRQKVVAECTSCRKILEVFDPFHHGYNAVICGEWKTEPPSREATERYPCKCGNEEFSLGVSAIYDADTDDLAGLNKQKRSESYGSFSVYATCLACERVASVVNYETA